MAGRGFPPRPRIARFGEDSAPKRSSRPDAPAWLDGEARAKWDEVCPLLDGAGILSKLDQGLLAAYCVAWASFVECTALIAQHGRATNTGKGGWKNSPYVSQQVVAMNQLRLIGAQLGLSPEGRLRIHAEGDAGAEDPMDAFLEGG
jgi:P27 family predicted phage terminase small subunit